MANSRAMSRRRARPRTAAAAAPTARAAPLPRDRIAGVDALRGGALCLMIVYHFAFDLRFYRVTNADFNGDPFWLGFRALIVTSFLALVGISLVLADRAGVSGRRFRQRIGMIVACALAASVGSWLAFRTTYIYFGILHCIAVASVLASPFVRRPRSAMLIGLAVMSPGVVSHRRSIRALVDRIHDHGRRQTTFRSSRGRASFVSVPPPPSRAAFRLNPLPRRVMAARGTPQPAGLHGSPAHLLGMLWVVLR
jgi:hypothetical protein